MSKALAIFNTPRSQMPSHVAEFLSEESNIQERNTVPSLSYEGKVWTVSINGQKTKMMKRDENGDEVAMPVMRVVILDWNQKRGRTYYEGSYDPAKPGTPLCWSEDGVKPHPQAQAPQHSRCDLCPMSVKGSKVTDQGKQISACSQHRMIAVVPANNLDAPPLRMKLALTSDWDKNSPELEAQGWYGFRNYIDVLSANQVPHTAAMVTKMRFDPNTAYPKVMFSPDRWLEGEELQKVKALTKAPEVKSIIGGGYTPTGADGVKVISAQVTEVKAAPAPAPKPAPQAKPVTIDIDDMDDEDLPLVKPKAPIKVMDDDDDDIVVAKPKKAKAAPKEAVQDIEVAKSAATKSGSKDLDDILTEWGED